MCGIYCSISRDRSVKPDERLKASLKSRGPDSQNEYTGSFKTTSNEHYLTFTSTVLALRGDYVQSQPLVDEPSGSVLCWNGEAWKVDGKVIQGNDSLHVFQLLLSTSRDASKGPFAFVFYDGLNETLYYGRDRLGRRSLLIQSSESGDLRLSSLWSGEGIWTEVPYDGIQIMTLTDAGGKSRTIPWIDPIPPINGIHPSSARSLLESSSTAVALLQKQLTNSMKLRAADIPGLGLFDHDRTESVSPKVAILFSGGLDCTVLARIAHDILDLSEPIDLLNVAFENPRSAATARASGKNPYELCPDRITGRRSFTELCNACPNRIFQFVAIDIPFTESQAHRSQILELMYPHNTEMDLSIAMALYFASRGQGNAYGPTSVHAELGVRQYKTSARVLLSGLGADELFAGYTRHATAFSRRGYPGLIEELSLDITRLGKRNLGRDDRIISYWGKEARYPYLDEDLVRWALTTPVWEKCGFGELTSEHQHQQQEIEPAKKVLRLLAVNLGLDVVAHEKKRAIQFGARTAKMESRSGRTKGTDLLTP